MLRAPRPVPRSFYLHPPEAAARNLLGKLVVRKLEGELLAGRIVETEAYFGLDDPAAHAFAGETARNRVLFGPPGHAYVYFIYGMHYCLNISCEPEGTAGCVLIRALEPVAGLETMARLRSLPSGTNPRLLTSGPGRLCQALGITRKAFNGCDVSSVKSNLQIADDGYQPEEIAVTPRIGIRKAADLPARFVIAGNAFITKS